MYKGFTLNVEKKVYKNTRNWREDLDEKGNPILASLENVEVENCFLQRVTANESEEYGISLNRNIYKIHINKKYDISGWKNCKCTFGQGDFTIVFTSIKIPNMPFEFSHNQFILVEDVRNG